MESLITALFTLAMVVAAALLGGWASYQLRTAPLVRSLELHLMERSQWERRRLLADRGCESRPIEAGGDLRANANPRPQCAAVINLQEI